MVQRQKFSVLRKLGCVMVMFAALVSIYWVTESTVELAVATATLGVRQVMKEKCDPERFLEWLHTLVLMDDTVILSTNRHTIIKRLKFTSFVRNTAWL